MAGEENPADLFTKHLESAAKLKQPMGLFSCQFIQGRAKSAPNLKKAAMADRKSEHASDQVIALAQLPHLMTAQVMDDKFPIVRPVNESYGEEDIPVEEELGDPVPRLTRSTPGSTRTRAGRAGGTERGEPQDRAYCVTDTGCPGNVSGPGPTGARSVGRCLGRHSLRYAIVQETDAGGRRLRHPRLRPSCPRTAMAESSPNGYGRVTGV